MRSSDMPYDRASLKRPEQFIHKLNEERQQRERDSVSTRVFSADGKRVIITGVQPDGSWGIKEYLVNGDNLILQTVVL